MKSFKKKKKWIFFFYKKMLVCQSNLNWNYGLEIQVTTEKHMEVKKWGKMAEYTKFCNSPSIFQMKGHDDYDDDWYLRWIINLPLMKRIKLKNTKEKYYSQIARNVTHPLLIE